MLDGVRCITAHDDLNQNFRAGYRKLDIREAKPLYLHELDQAVADGIGTFVPGHGLIRDDVIEKIELPVSEQIALDLADVTREGYLVRVGKRVYRDHSGPGWRSVPLRES